MEGYSKGTEHSAEQLSGKESNTVRVKCESCGGNMVFDPQTQNLKCEHCGSVVSFDKNKAVKENDIQAAFEHAETWGDETTVYRCENCGAQIALPRDVTAVTCPYCSTPHVKKNEDVTGLKPNAVYPFILTKDMAIERAKHWAKSRIFAPSKFKKSLVAENLSGIYQPCFTFDSNTHSTYEGRLGDRKTRTVKTSNGTKTETYIEWYHVRGDITIFFDDVFISGGQISQKHLDNILPYDISTLCVYEQKYLSGYAASHYVKDIKDCWKDAKDVMDAKIRKRIVDKHHADVVDYLNVSTMHDDVTYKYVLCPVYYLNYTYNNKSYPVMVNGNTGNATGSTPISPLRVAIAVVLGLALLIGLILLFSEGEVEIELGLFESLLHL